MEEGIDLFESIRRGMSIENVDADTYSPLTLAYIGDAIYEIVIRTMVVSWANIQVNKLHKKSSALVKAQTQAQIIKLLFDDLDDREMTIYKRGRNAKSFTKAKNATVIDYRMATGFEALMGYLYMSHKSERMMELISMGLERLENDK
ncbi:MAG: ribonuclease III [Lachnospiraceae bacterium]|nr:ribonuclease III [Lachnospiraceae bacterium]MDE6254536.1 ribonuclease III [Lachnospiraceae bacterium]